LTGEGRYAEAMERTLHNALLGALQPDGHLWAYFLELEGDAAPSICQYPEIKTNCCVMSGYRGLAMTSGRAVEQDAGGLRFADFASLISPGIAGEAAYWVWFPQPTLDR